jgi:hypothetical protein
MSAAAAAAPPPRIKGKANPSQPTYQKHSSRHISYYHSAAANDGISFESNSNSTMTTLHLNQTQSECTIEENASP